MIGVCAKASSSKPSDTIGLDWSPLTRNSACIVMGFGRCRSRHRGDHAGCWRCASTLRRVATASMREFGVRRRHHHRRQRQPDGPGAAATTGRDTCGVGTDAVTGPARNANWLNAKPPPPQACGSRIRAAARANAGATARGPAATLEGLRDFALRQNACYCRKRGLGRPTRR